MRGIRFRGKAKMSKEELNEIGVPHINGWVFGNYSDSHILGKVIESNSEYITHEWWCEVDSATVGQFIGKKDKSGQEIYERDILRFDDTGEEGYEYKEGYDFTNVAAVTWCNGRFELNKFGDTNSSVVDDMNSCHEDFMLIFEASEVIGNIHDNPELLEGE